MSAKITTPFGHAVPPAPRHSVTVHMPTWQNVQKYGSNPRQVIASFKNVYPRMRPHQDTAELTTAVLELSEAEDKAAFLFSSLQSARECVDYAVSPKRDNGADKSPVDESLIEIRAFTAKDAFYAVIFPSDKLPVLAGFWSTPGVNASSRFAEINLDHLNQLTEIDLPAHDLASRPEFDSPAHKTIRERIVHHLNRAPLHPDHKPRPKPEDVYFFPTGMATIYKTHMYLLNHNNQKPGTTVLFGMAFMNTLTAFEEYGNNYKFFGLGTDSDLADLEIFLREEHDAGRHVQAIWAEFPANPILVTPDLTRLSSLAREYNTILAVDDTIGSFANIDIMAQVDILVTSLTKSFNGYADAIAGSVVLNPASRKYTELKALYDKYYIPELYVSDAETIEHNSRDYLTRQAKLNSNAAAIASYLHTCAQDPKSAVKKVHYPDPGINASGRHYQEYMRPATDEFSPGYGCLLNVELEDLPSTIAFYDNLNVHNGPHLGAPFTLCFAYTMCAYANRLEWAAEQGLRPTQIRISAGLEDIDVLLEDFRIAVKAADKVKAAAMQNGSNGTIT